MKKDDKYPPVNVLNVMRGFSSPALKHQVTPYRFETNKGETFKVKQIRQVHRERVGDAIHMHYVLKTTDDRFFHLVLDSASFTWRMVQEVDEQLFFSD